VTIHALFHLPITLKIIDLQIKINATLCCRWCARPAGTNSCCTTRGRWGACPAQHADAASSTAPAASSTTTQLDRAGCRVADCGGEHLGAALAIAVGGASRASGRPRRELGSPWSPRARETAEVATKTGEQEGGGGPKQILFPHFRMDPQLKCSISAIVVVLSLPGCLNHSPKPL
jgi:hypothetical protein